MRASLILVLGASLAGCGGSNAMNPDGGGDGGNPMPRSLTIIHTNDEHSHLIGFGPERDDYPAPTTAGTGAITGGVGRRAALIAQEKTRIGMTGDAVLTVSAGDNTMGTLTQTLFPAAPPDFAALKRMGYDVDTFGNHEFDFGPAALAAAITAQQANGGLVPTVASNIHFSSTDSGDDALAALFDESGSDMTKPVHRSLLVTTSNGLKVGFIGIVGIDAAHDAPLKAPITFSVGPSNSETNAAEDLTKLYQDLQPVVDHLRNDLKADVVVALSHSGVNAADLTVSEDHLIAQNVSGIDVIVSGHTHTVYAANVINNKTTGKPVLIQQAGQFGQFLGEIRLTVNPDGSVTFDMGNTKVLTIDDKIVSDPAWNMTIDSAIDAIESGPFIASTLQEIVGASVPHATRGDLYFHPLGSTTFDVPGQIEHKETPMLVLSSDALLTTVDALNLTPPNDLAIQAHGVIRANLTKGKTGVISFGDVFRILPLGISITTTPPTSGYPLARIAVIGWELKAALEIVAGYSYSSDNASAQFLVPSGLKFTYDTSRPIFDTSSQAQITNYMNGRVTQIFLNTNHSDLDNNYTLIFDVNQGGWQAGYNPITRPYVVVLNAYLAEFASSVGVTLRKADGTNAASLADVIIHRTDGSEIKDYEALASYIAAQCTANGGTLPSRYDPNQGTFPRRAICSGPLCVQ